MFHVLACVVERHNLWLVLVAAGVCLVACAGGVFVLRGTVGDAHRRSRLLGAMFIGGGAWATHFVAMLAYEPGLSFGFDAALTVLSAALGILIAWLAFEVFERRTSFLGLAMASVLLSTAVTALHYVGMSGLIVGAYKLWAWDLIAWSWAICTVLFGLALHALRKARTLPASLLVSGLLAGGIASLHFTGMGALTLAPDPRLLAIVQGGLSRTELAVIVAAGAASVILVSVILTFADRMIAASRFAVAMHDSLTGLPNRRHFLSAIPELLVDSLKDHDQVALVMIELDRMKQAIDVHGHAACDQAIVVVANALRETSEHDGLVARVGPDEFALVVPFVSSTALISRLSTITRFFDGPICVEAGEILLRAVMGAAIAPTDGVDAEALMRRASIALHRAREVGHARIAFFEDGMDACVGERADLERALRLAVLKQEITPHFQPLVSFATGEVAGYEILARWTNGRQGSVSPEQFIPIAEDIGVLNALTFGVLRRACREALTWPCMPNLSLNVSPAQLLDPEFIDGLFVVLAECKFPAPHLEIEVTEDALVVEIDRVRSILDTLKRQGIRIALDDFGTGYSSLRHLRELPFDVLKIDQSFIRGMFDNTDAESIVKVVIQLAHNLGLAVTAEGVETARHAQALWALGCDHGQGYYFSRPSSGEVIRRQMRSQAEGSAIVTLARRSA